ncbi:MAG: universal stress protein [Bacteroidales bacterium]|nr:universal stress protein [Bacteroidales bacterium]MBN2763844.1 universal stress protein [Bacteroidales bacterium]
MFADKDNKNVSKDVKSLKKIFVPVDYSECSVFACRYALKIASLLQAEIKLFHTYYSPAFDLIELASAVQTQTQLKEEALSNLEASENETMKSFIQSLHDFIAESNLAPVDISFEIKPGVPEDEIRRFSEWYEPDLVVMGTHGKGSGVSSIMGSVTAAIIGKINYPVLAIPEKYKFIGEKNIKKVMYVTDFNESDFLSIRNLMNLTDQLGLDIYCTHIGDDPKSWDKIRMEGLMEYFRKSYGEAQVGYSFISQKNLLEDLDQLIRDKEINILSVTSHRRNIIEKLFRTNMTKKLFYHTSIPLLVFPS